MSRLGIIAGGGGLPQKLVSVCRRDHKPFFVLAFKGQTEELLVQNAPHAWTRLGATNEAIRILKENDVTEVVMAGSMRRPSLFEMKPDWRTIQVFAKLGKAAFGDDALLRAIAEVFEKEGFIVRGAHEIDPSLITTEGVLGKHAPNNDQQKDIAFGILLTRTLGQMDVGQGAVIQQGVAIGVEAVEGTDALLYRCKKHQRKGPGGVLVKSCKPQQDRRLDLPAIGINTVRRAYQAGLSGIALEAGASFLLDREETIAAADKLGMFILGFKPL